jgi:hypothetical protein
MDRSEYVQIITDPDAPKIIKTGKCVKFFPGRDRRGCPAAARPAAACRGPCAARSEQC